MHMSKSGLVMSTAGAGTKDTPSRKLRIQCDDSLLVIARTMESRMDLFVALGSLGCRIQTCDSAIEGLKAMACREPNLVIVEYNSLDPHGRGLVNSLRKDHLGTGVILLVGPQDRAGAMRAGIRHPMEILTTPFLQDELLDTARRLLGHIGREGM